MRSVVIPGVGRSELLEQDEPPAGPADAVVDVEVSIVSPGTERAVLLDLPAAGARFPEFPGHMAAGTVRRAPSLPAGTRVAVRRAGHRSVAVLPECFVRAVPDHVPSADAAVWQLAITALQGLLLGGQRAGEPVTVIGSGLLGVITRRLAAALGAPSVLAVADSPAKAWTTHGEPTTSFTPPDRVGAESPLVLDVTGSAAGLPTAVAATAAGGRVVLLGSPPGELADVPLQALYDRRLALIGSHVSRLGDTEEAALSDLFFDLLAEGRFTVGDVLADHPAAEAPLVYRRLADDRTFVSAALHWTGPVPAARPLPGPAFTGRTSTGRTSTGRAGRAADAEGGPA
ncbi:hypothetical protein ACFCX4_09245 [Kitasatospora sp. NPDC056327]|uniref:hypothetical protein n=1 Tax=Kitasatospora sp. NPDC056327 TaxID=3345785 RepID=UPI0035E256C8